MTFTIRTRGAGGSLVAEFACPKHGRFGATVPRDPQPDEQPCPECGTISPWVISAPFYKPPLGWSGKTGKSDPYLPHQLNTRALAEGMPRKEWDAIQDKAAEDRRRKKNKEEL